MNGSPGLIYIETVLRANGTGITLSFEPGTNRLGPSRRSKSFGSGHPALASVCGPARRTGRQIQCRILTFCYFVVRQSQSTPLLLGDFAARNIVPEIQRLLGLAKPRSLHSTRDANLDRPSQADWLSLSAADVTNAVQLPKPKLLPAQLVNCPMPARYHRQRWL
jgi:multidrug efflux pump